MNWKSFLDTTNAKTFVLPVGWDSRDKVAEQLECSPERVRVLLAPAIKGGSIEQGVFPVWDTVTKRLIRMTAYRRVTEPAARPKKRS